MAELGSLYMGTDDIQALRWFRPAAEKGHGGAQVNLGHMYERGYGVPQDDAEASRLFRLAAEQRFAQAQYNLGLMYGGGRGVPKNNAETARWFGLAAEQGHADAQLMLGVLYATGNGVPQNESEAAEWFRLAADQGHPKALEILGQTEPPNTPQSPPENRGETWRCFKSWEPDTTLVALTRQGDSGEVAVSGLTRSARFQVNGLELRWDFGLDDDGNFEYAFVIQPDRTGLYYDFSRSRDGTASPQADVRLRAVAVRGPVNEDAQTGKRGGLCRIVPKPLTGAGAWCR